MTRSEFEAAWKPKSMRTRPGRSFRLPCRGSQGSAELFMYGSPEKGVTVELLAGKGRRWMKTFFFSPGSVRSEEEAAEASLRMALDYAREQAAIFEAMADDLGAAAGIPASPESGPAADPELGSRADELSLFLRNRAGASGPINEYDKMLLRDASDLIDQLADPARRPR